MSLHDGLRELIVAALKERGESSADLNDTSSLIRSGLLDSLALLQVAIWIEKQTSTRIDLRSLDMREEWDSIRDICAYVDKRAA